MRLRREQCVELADCGARYCFAHVCEGGNITVSYMLRDIRNSETQKIFDDRDADITGSNWTMSSWRAWE